MSLTKLAISRPVTILMLILALVILGWQSRSRMAVDLYPKVDIPYLFISTVYPGTGPEEVETLVSKPIEDAVSSISGLKKLTSTSSEGVSSVRMEFEIGTDLDIVSADVRSKLDSVRGKLPDGAKSPVVVKLDFGATPVISLSVGSKSRSSKEIRETTDDVIKDKLSQLSGVGAVTVTGGDIREIKVAVDKNRLEAYGINILQVVSAIRSENLNIPSGSIEEYTRTSAVRVMGEFTSPDEVYNVRIPNIMGNTNLKVSDIAIVSDDIKKATVYTRVNMKPSVAITIQKQSDGNTVKVVDLVKVALEDMTGRPYTTEGKENYKKLGSKWSTGVPAILPADYEINVSMDQSTFIKDTLDDVYASLTEGAMLAVLIVFLFLHSLRGTFIVALAIPTSMIATFMIMNGLGFTLNMMSMMGLSLSVGILVDDSIVVLENIHRHLMMGESPHDAALNGRAEIGLAAMAITMVDVVVFIPIAFMGGIVGQFFRQFGITIATATLFSLLMSFTLTPMLASRWLKSKDEEETEDEKENEQPGLFKKFVNLWEKMYGGIDQTYRKVLDWALCYRPAVICIGIMTLLASISIAVPKPTAEQLPKLLPALIIAVILVALIWYGVSSLRGALRWIFGFIAIPLTIILMGGLQAIAMKTLQTAVPYITTWGLMISLTIIAINLSRVIKDDKRETAGGVVKPILTIFAMWTLLSLYPGKFGFEFQPKVDRRQLSVSVEREVGASLKTTNRSALMIEEALNDKNEYPEVKTVFTNVGSSSGSVMSAGSSSADQAQIDVELRKDEDYGIDSTKKFLINIGLMKKEYRSTDEIIRKISKQFNNIPGAKIKVQETAGMGPGGAPISIEVSGINTSAALRAAEQIKQVVQNTPGTYAVDLSWRQGRPELQALINRDRAAQYGMTTSQISNALRTNMEGDTTLKYRENGKEYDIRISLPEDQRNNTSQLASMVVGTKSNGTPVRLSEVAQIINATGPTKIERVNRLRAVTVNGYLYSGYQLGNVQNVIKAEVDKLEKEGKINLQGVTVGWAGQARNMAESFKSMGDAFGLAVVLVFMLMAALFESLISPLIVMLAVPQAMAGGLFGLILAGKSLSIISMIGFIMLISLVTKNAILLVDYTNTLRREHGMDRKSALKQAGPTRLRPILMTTLAMIFGMMPTAVALANGSEMRQPMAIVVIGGLMLSMFLTLLMVPVFYDIVDELGMKFAQLKQRILEKLKAK